MMAEIQCAASEHLSILWSTGRLSIGLPTRWHHGLYPNHLIKPTWVQVGIGRRNSWLELCLLGRLITGVEPLELEQACITAVGGTKGDRGFFSCKASLS